MGAPVTRAALRSHLLQLTGIVSSLAALVALLDPDRVAGVMGLFLVGVNGYGQFFAVYVGVRMATALLAFKAAGARDMPLLGDLTAMFILAQPVGRVIAAFVIGLPQGSLLIVSGIEVAGGLALLALRPPAQSSRH